MSYLRTKAGAEIDLILSRGKRHVLLEIKSTTRADEIEIRKLARLAEAFKGGDVQAYYLSRDPHEAQVSGVICKHWTRFLEKFERSL